MAAFYNEIDPFAAEWLRGLIRMGEIAPGIVDERDIRDVRPSDLDGFEQCHFFAGIGGWSYALRLAGIPDSARVWTGSCPCQPFSAAGRGLGFADERHLWPAFFHLIDRCRPERVYGEQVASKDGLAWLDLVHADLEGAGYACGAVDMGAASVGAPHIRQRLWFVANADKQVQGGRRVQRFGEGHSPSDGAARQRSERLCAFDILGDASTTRLERRDAGTMGNEREAAERTGEACAMGDTNRVGQTAIRRVPGWADPFTEGSPWASPEWLSCRDGKSRPTQPGLQPLAHGIPNRVGTLRGAGNAIVPAAAAEVIRATWQ